MQTFAIQSLFMNSYLFQSLLIQSFLIMSFLLKSLSPHRNVISFLLIMARQTNPHPHFVFLKYLSTGWSVFQTDFCIATVNVLSTIKGPNVNFSRDSQKLPQKPKIAGKLDLIGKNGFSFRH